MVLVITDVNIAEPSFTQQVRVGYVDSAYVQVVKYPVQQLSGNPGYLSGFPLLVRAHLHMRYAEISSTTTLMGT